MEITTKGEDDDEMTSAMDKYQLRTYQWWLISTEPLAWVIPVYTKDEKIEPRSEKTGLRGFRPGLTQTRLYSHRRWLET